MKSKTLKTIISISLIVIISVTLVLHMIQQIKYMVYTERKSLLTQLIETSAATVDDNINSEWRIIDFYTNDVITDVKDDTEVMDYLITLSYSNDYYFLVDENGKYYSSDGHVGRIVDNEYYYSDEENVEYLGGLPHLEEDGYIVFRKKLDNPIIAKYNGEDIAIIYTGCVHSLDELNETISELFLRNNNTIIFDRQTGVMLYKKFNIGLLIEGYNVYSKYSDDLLKYGVKSEDVINSIKNNETTVSLMKINNKDTYICTSDVDVDDWTLLMVVSDEFFGSSDNGIILTVLLSMAGVVLFFGIAATYAYLFKMKSKNEVERLNEQEKVNEALESAYKTKSDFLSYMSHDIRTPINGIIGMSNIGMNLEGNSDKVNDCFKKIDTAGKHLLSLVNDVLDMSALESGKTVVKEDNFNIKNLLNNCLDIINGQLANRELDVISNFELVHENIIGDELHLKQILINILGNALKFTNDGGKICFTAKETKIEDNKVTYEIEIEDTGIGIEQNILDHLFDAYVQGNNRSVYKGSGLGMAISYQFAKLMNGDIKVESVVGKGSKFTVIVPFVIDEDKHEDNIAGLNILLVEDNELNIEIAKELLTSKGAKIIVAKDGLEAIAAFEASKIDEIDVILMDMMMPRMGGLDASIAIRKLERSDNNVPIIILSANTFLDTNSANEANINGFATKPIDINKLAMTIVEVRNEYEKNK